MNIQQQISFGLIVIVGLVVALVQYLADQYFLYWQWWWLDVVMHFLGGVFITALCIWTYSFFTKRNPTPLFALSTVFIVGISWELFEVSTGMMSPTMIGYAFDTATDIVLDMLGVGISAYLLLMMPVLNKKPA